jgi:hypothetical protein
MTISLRAASTFDHDTGATGGWAVPKPTGTAAGDVLIAIVGAIGASVTLADTTGGWTLIGSETTNSNINLSAYYRVAGGSEPSTYTFTPSAGVKGFGCIVGLIGADTTTPIDSSAHSTVTSSATVPPADTISGTGCWLLTAAIGRHNFAAARTWSDSDGSDASRYNHGSSSGSGFDFTGGVFDSNRALTSGSATRTLTTSSSTENAASWWAIAIKPAASGALDGRVYQAALSAPQAAPALLGRLYRTYLAPAAPSGGLTGRVYRASLVAANTAGASGKSGFYRRSGGNLAAVSVHVAKNGQVQ